MKIDATISRIVTLTLTAEDIINLLNLKVDPARVERVPKGFVNWNIPDNAAVVMRVPSGGDYSGELISPSTLTPLRITWTEKES